MKKYISIIIIILLFPISVFAEEFDIYSNNAIIYNLNDNSILYEKNSDERVSIASLTKIMTAIVAIENIDDINKEVTLTNNDFKGLYEANASLAGFNIGEEVTYKDLLYGLMLPSGAEAAQALCNNISGSVDEYVNLMNNKAKELGLNNTHFKNPTGLDDEEHYSTVKDVSKLFKYALNNEIFKEIISTDKYTTSNNRITLTSTIYKSLNKYNLNMDYLIGGKTGTTKDAGLCLASIAEYNNIKYLQVTVKAPFSRENPYNYLDQKQIYEYYFNNYDYITILNKKDTLVKINTKYAKKDYIEFKSNKEIKKYLKKDIDISKIKYKYTGKNIITLDMNKNTKLGKVDIIYEDKVLDNIDIILKEKQKLDIFKYIKANKQVIIIPISILILLFIIIKLKKK